MDRRMGLHETLCGVMTRFFGEDSRKRVYFQPPEDLKIEYPCMIYHLSEIRTVHAGNLPYAAAWKYSVTFITRDPDSPVPGEMAALPLCKFDRYFTNDNLHHYVFIIYEQEERDHGSFDMGRTQGPVL